jgi:hypothetical protein
MAGEFQNYVCRQQTTAESWIDNSFGVAKNCVGRQQTTAESLIVIIWRVEKLYR